MWALAFGGQFPLPMSQPTDTPYSGTIHDAGSSYVPPSPPPPAPQTRGFAFQSRNAARAGLTMGSTLAMVISWNVHHSILWAIIHGFMSWVYVVYYAMTR